MAVLLYKYSFSTRIHDIDAAGVMFFARFFYHVHDAYEDFLNHHCQTIQSLLNSNYLLPINHTEATFKAPIMLNEKIIIKISLEKITLDTFTLNYQFIDLSGKIKAIAKTRHVCLNASTKKRSPLSPAIESLLTQAASA